MEDYEKKYNDILCRLQALVDIQSEVTKECFYKEFPELTKSKDEKIRKELLWHFKGDGKLIDPSGKTDSISYQDIRNWLEKQKPVENIEQVDNLHQYLYGNEEQKPVEWSEEDEEIRKSIIDRIERRRMSSIGSESAICENQIAWLKSLRPQKQWKPSSQQICALDYVIKEYESTNISLYKESIKQLIFLREQLKAL